MIGGDLPFGAFAETVLDGSVIDRFGAIARRFPSEAAVQDAAICLTYAELAELVNRIAAAITAAVQGRPGPIAILLQANAYLPAAMLGVLAAGRAYVPLDTEFSIERNGVIIDDVGACAILSSGHLLREVRHRLPHELLVIDIDDLPSPGSPDISRIRPDDIAAIYYTSGSSGRPKSVAWNHRSVVHWVQVFTDAAQIKCSDRIALLFSAGVSASWRAIYSSLLNGACLNILPPLDIGLPGIIEQIRGRGITILHAVPALMRLIFDARSDDLRFDTVRLVCIGGDRVEWSDVDQCRQAFSQNVIVYSILTSTEGGPFIHSFTDDLLRITMARPPAGRAAPGWTVSVVNDHGEPISDGEIGEIVVSSRYIAVGYWDGAALRARAFPTDPADPSKRVFNTGDRGRCRPDGLIEFIGRNDQQIKLHGHRIEPAEVEAALAALREINDAVVVVWRNEDGQPRSLAAYVEPKPGLDDLTPRKVAAVLKTRLPRYMIPATIVVVEKLPRLPNLKIDREELRRRDQRERERRLAAPMPQGAAVRTKTEERLLELWCKVLGRQDIGYDDDFFLCGGDSVSAFVLMRLIEEEFQYQAPLTILAEAPTVSQLAHRLERMTLGAINKMIPIQTVGRRRPLFAVYNAGGHGLALLAILRSLGPNQPCYWLQPPAMDWTSTNCATLPQIAAYYVNEARAVQPHGPYRLLGTGFGGVVAFEMTLQLQETGQQVEYLAILDADAPTCVFGDRIDICDSRELLRTLNAQPTPVSRFEAETRSIVETQIRMKRDYVLDSKSARDIFGGELTFFHCTGKPVIAGQDRRRLWRSFASGVRLLLVPGRRGTHNREPQYTAVRNLLEACLNDKPVTGCDPGSVYDRHYRMDDVHQPSKILSSMGDVYRIDRERIQGSVDEIRIHADAIQVMGWAVDPCGRQPGQTIAVFLNGQFLGYGASSEPRPDVARYLGEDSALFSGFNFIFEAAVAANVLKRPQLFVLSSDGSAAELRAGIEPVAIGSVKKLSETEHSGVILAGHWSVREQWGVWSSGRQATVIFDASSLPDHFRVTIRANLFPPGPLLIQTVRVSDENGTLLTIISSGQPNGEFTVKMQKSPIQSRSCKCLVFEIDTPTSPQELGISEDRRKLGIGLVSLTFQE